MGWITQCHHNETPDFCFPQFHFGNPSRISFGNDALWIEKKKEGISMRKKKRAFTKKDDILDARKCITMVASILLGSPRCNPSRASPALFCFFSVSLGFSISISFWNAQHDSESTALWARCQKCWVWLPISACNAVHVIVRCDLSRDTARLTCCFHFEFQRESKYSKLKSRKHQKKKKKKSYQSFHGYSAKSEFHSRPCVRIRSTKNRKQKRKKFR